MGSRGHGNAMQNILPYTHICFSTYCPSPFQCYFATHTTSKPLSNNIELGRGVYIRGMSVCIVSWDNTFYFCIDSGLEGTAILKNFVSILTFTVSGKRFHRPKKPLNLYFLQGEGWVEGEIFKEAITLST